MGLYKKVRLYSTRFEIQLFYILRVLMRKKRKLKKKKRRRVNG